MSATLQLGAGTFSTIIAQPDLGQSIADSTDMEPLHLDTQTHTHTRKYAHTQPISADYNFLHTLTFPCVYSAPVVARVIFLI